MQKAIQQFWRDEDGATAIEYGLIAGLIAVVIVGGATALGTNLEKLFCELAAKIGAKVATGAVAC